MEKYRVVDYHDVWGNEKDGYEVNNIATIGEIELEDYTNIDEILSKLKELEYLSDKACVESFVVWNDYEMIEFTEKTTDKPMFRLELVS